LGGDGFWLATDPDDPNIVYTEYQYGNAYRYDRKSGEGINIKPRERKGELAYKWNWNAPLILSPHKNTRLYMAANKVFKSEDRGNTWKVISEDLTSQVDRNSFPVMGKYWPAEAVVKDVSTSLWGTIVSLAESPVKEGLIYAGTDDGVISITEDGGENWRQIKEFPGVPEYTYVSDLWPDRFDENVVYATFDNLKRDDFTPYVFKSSDKGKSWENISGNLPENGTVHTFVQDFVRPDLYFAGTEFGVFFTVDGGENWVQLKEGIPVISVKDIAIQEDENDLVLATFGRGFYILDDYSPLRKLSPEFAEKQAHIFEVPDALMYVQTRGRNNQGDTYYKAPNPEFGATFTYYLKEIPKTKAQLRKEKEKELFEEGKPIPQPDWRELQLEDKQEKTHLVFSVYDDKGNVVRRITKAPSKGINRVNWDLRYAAPVNVKVEDAFDPTKLNNRNYGILVMPGDYSVDLKLWHEGEFTELAGPVEFTARKLNNTTLPAEDYNENVAFGEKVSKLAVAMVGSNQLIDELITKVEHIKEAIYSTPGANQQLMNRARELGKELEQLHFTMNGVPAKASWEEIPPAQMPLTKRLSTITYTHMGSTSGITATEKQEYEILTEEFPPVLEKLKQIVAQDIPALEAQLNELNAPWTPGRVPDWKE
ncbi:MAG: WD40/YVTN/BNR-like repeat-containing protein, partial [Prolixibacteraceae bacterium]